MTETKNPDRGVTVYVGKVFDPSPQPRSVLTNSREISMRLFVTEGSGIEEYLCKGIEGIVDLSKEKGNSTFVTDEKTLCELLELYGIETAFYDPGLDETRHYDGLRKALADSLSKNAD